MSKLILILLFAAVNTGLMAVPISAVDIPVHISPMNKWIIVDKDNWKTPQVGVSIRKEDGTILIQENISVSKKYNLKNLPDGNYVLDLEDGQQIRTQSLQVDGDILYSKDISTIYKPHLVINQDYINMNLMTQGQKADISIQNAESNTVFSEKISNEVSATRRYNIKDLPAGNYIFKVSLNGQEFIKSFTK